VSTVNHIQPEYEWSALRELEDLAVEAAVSLREQLAVYEIGGEEVVFDSN